MKKFLPVSWLAAPIAAIGMSGCATTSGGLTSSAERLERSALAFQSDSRDERESRRYRDDARDLTQETRDFRRALTDRRSDARDVRDAFSDVSRSYHELRDEVERDRSRDAERDFEPVTQAYLDVERAMQTTDNRRRDRYARDE